MIFFSVPLFLTSYYFCDIYECRMCSNIIFTEKKKTVRNESKRETRTKKNRNSNKDRFFFRFVVAVVYFFNFISFWSSLLRFYVKYHWSIQNSECCLHSIVWCEDISIFFFFEFFFSLLFLENEKTTSKFVFSSLSRYSNWSFVRSFQ